MKAQTSDTEQVPLPKLLPCPFCGAALFLYSKQNESASVSGRHPHNYCIARSMVVIRGQENRWNQRAPEPQSSPDSEPEASTPHKSDSVAAATTTQPAWLDEIIGELRDATAQLHEKYGPINEIRWLTTTVDQLTAALPSTQQAGRPYGYVCHICGDPVDDSQPTEHSERGLVHTACCVPEPESVADSRTSAVKSAAKPEPLACQSEKWVKEAAERVIAAIYGHDYMCFPETFKEEIEVTASIIREVGSSASVLAAQKPQDLGDKV